MQARLCVVGLGYVGLPLAHSFAKKLENVVGFDVSEGRIAELRDGFDRTGELTREQMEATTLKVTSDPAAITEADVVIVAVPTPVDKQRRPDLSILKSACQTVGQHMKRGATVVFESTVFPGATEEICAPILAEASGMTSGVDFKLAYSPERINPGDKEHPVEKIVKVVSGEDEETAEAMAQLYGIIIDAGTHKATSIRVAEAAKVLENTQRDINIALMNELARICRKAGIRTADVLEAASTKWNFLPFKPGLVGGHCIGVDPYYLTSKAEELGYHPEVILSGRRINDSMPRYVATEMLQMIAASGSPIRGSRVGVLGVTFKENVPDVRNSKVLELVDFLKSFGLEVIAYDPMANSDEVKDEYGLDLSPKEGLTDLDALVIAVRHDAFMDGLDAWIGENLKAGGALVDLKSILSPKEYEKNYNYWSL
ncbi:nucleotide sugar dehydrogenase [Aurantiacibacter rhizosphaerae]|uniref:Nucleotide sugar dehydrogenase n=1 Tax=Aurantiacibacter rhizosphaerae TaxID=2691582 RepID=A0A844XA39_9SPHN|nr:nucleotide sugar dehydrogenase [Aurantiacibacter rhizosphaerae]MWV26649.1 nucleotide sugar dehydrogenase [Aurantiacibacter rhizosphaerae]